MDTTQLKYIVEAALLAAGRPLGFGELRALVGQDGAPDKDQIRAALTALQEDYAERGIALEEVANGFRIQIRSSMSGWLSGLWEERAPRYSRALLETLAIIAYRQPVTRGDVEDIRGVGVTTNIMRTLLERSWIRVVGFRDVPGKPAMYGTTKEFLDYFGLKRLDDLPALANLKDLDSLTAELDLRDPGADAVPAAPVASADAVDSAEAVDLAEAAVNESGGHDVELPDDEIVHADMDADMDADEHEPVDVDADDDADSLSSATVIPLRAR